MGPDWYMEYSESRRAPYEAPMAWNVELGRTPTLLFSDRTKEPNFTVPNEPTQRSLGKPTRLDNP